MIRIVEYGEISPEDILCRDITAERDVELAVDVELKDAHGAPTAPVPAAAPR